MVLLGTLNECKHQIIVYCLRGWLLLAPAKPSIILFLASISPAHLL